VESSLLMMNAVAAAPCRTYIVYEHGLFAQGVRSVLENRRAVQIVGMQNDVAKALKAVRSLKPEVVIVEECSKKGESIRLRPFLDSAVAGRVVTLSLDHAFATVYNQKRLPASDPADLVKAIRGTRDRKQSQPDSARKREITARR
jgi:DNA-binding NarL/FixJ family response regulator